MNRLKKSTLDFSKTGHLQPLVTDYVLHPERIQDFFSVPFHLNKIGESVYARNFSMVNRNVLWCVVKEQYESLQLNVTPFDSVHENIALLTDEKTFTVTTGHQLNLCSGPLYFIYKIASTINLTQQLKQKYPGYNFIPVYWMASEDHDLVEINHFNLYGKRFQWNTPQSGATGRMNCEGAELVLNELEPLLKNTTHGAELLQLFQKSYSKKHPLAEATRIFVHELFGRHGLLILDPDHAALKKLFADTMIDDAINHSAFTAVNNTIQSLEKNYKAQVHPREINLFYLGENFRSRIEKHGDRYEVLDHAISFTREELIHEVKNHPENFSPNVVLRPLYQETVLPNLAYVGGPAEIAYWLEYKTLFEHYNTPMPCLVLRSMAMIADHSTQKKLTKLGISLEDIFKPTDQLEKDFVHKMTNTGFVDDAKIGLEKLFEELEKGIVAIDITLKPTAEAEKQKILKGFHTLEEKINRSLKRQHETALHQIEKIKSSLFPDGIMQERHDNFSAFYAKWGDGFIDQLVHEMDPLEKKFFIFSEE